MNTRWWVFAGLLGLAGLASPFSVDLETERHLASGLTQDFYSLAPALIPSLALFIAAALLASGLRKYQKRYDPPRVRYGPPPPPPEQAAREALVFLSLGALLIAATLYDLYWLMVWDSTSDSLEFIWLILPAFAALFGSLWFINLRSWIKLAGLYALLVPAAMICVSLLARQVDFRQLTERRAGRVVQAIQAYHDREGRYPQNLSQLFPVYLLSVSKPVIFYGQDWCYDGGDGYFRLGYVDRKHWSDPNLSGKLVIAGGDAPDLPPICGQEIAALRKSYPKWYGMYKQ